MPDSTSATDPIAEPTEAIALLISGQHRLVEHLDALLASNDLDVSAPSSLPDWSIGHVITHITNSGDGQLRMLQAAATGEVGAQYPGGFEQRQDEIEQRAVLPAEEQVDKLRHGCAAIEAQLTSMPSWDGTGLAMFGELPIAVVPLMRTREVEIHHVDLGVGYTFDDLAPAYINSELGQMEAMWIARQPTGITTLPPEALAATTVERLAWLLGRAPIDGLEPAAIF